MPFAPNRSGDVVPVRGSDAVRIAAERSSGALETVTIDLSERSGETHCLIAFPAMPNDLDAAPPWPRVWMSGQYDDSDGSRAPFVLYVAAYRRGEQVGETPVRFFAGPEETRLVLDAPIPAEADSYQLVLYADRYARGVLHLRGIRLVAGTRQFRLGPEGHIVREIDRRREWRQEGNRVICRSVYGEHWAEMPPDWRLNQVHPAALQAAEWILFSSLDRVAFGVKDRPPDPDDADRRPVGTRTLLSFSLGTDSTAAMTLLPDATIRYYCERPYNRYFTRTGAEVRLPEPTPWETRLDRVDNLIRVPQTFEQLRLAAGAGHGFAHNYGYAAIGLLLADLTDAGTLAFGSVMEQVYLRSGNQFADVVALASSSYHSLRRVVNAAGLFLALPTAGCSEVLTNWINDRGRFAGLAISCPRAAPDGSPCGTCFKCFRKLRLDGDLTVPDPDDGVLHLLEKYPLKSATSVVYAAQRSGFRHPAIDPYRHLDLRLLERYFDYAVRHMLPAELATHVRSELERLEIAPMTADDEVRLRSLGQVFWPEEFDARRAGLPGYAGVQGAARATG